MRVGGWLQSDMFMDLLALSGEHLAMYVSQKPDLIQGVEGGFVVFAPNAQNQPQPKAAKEGPTLEKLLPVLNALSAP